MADENLTSAEQAPAPAPEKAARSEQQGGNRGHGRRGGRRNDRSDRDSEKSDYFEKVVAVNRCAKVVKGGRRFSFSALIVIGDRKGKVGVGFGKANEVSEAVRKATEGAKKRMESFSLQDATIPHEVFGEFDGAKVLVKPASPGTGLIAGSVVRAVLEAAGIKDVLTKSLGSSTPSNVVEASLEALRQLRSRESIFKIRGRNIRPKKAKADAKAEPAKA